MKRDFDLIRSILRDVEDTEPDHHVTEFTYDDIEQKVIDAHVVLLFEAGLLDGQRVSVTSGRSPYRVNGLTWEGHDFLDSIKDQSTWDKAKKNVLAPAGGVAFGVLKEWLLAEAKTRLGLP